MRSWRDRVHPSAVGLPVGHRKTAGLRREEVAMLAGLSVDYVVRLEQGRAERPSERETCCSVCERAGWGGPGR